MTDNEDLLGEFKEERKPYPPLEKKLPRLVTEKSSYEAIEKTNKPERFKIVDRKGNFDIYSYGHLLEISYQNGNIIITTTTRTFTLSGKNLRQIADFLSDRKVKNLIEFNPDTHKPPVSKNAIVIEKIERED